MFHIRQTEVSDKYTASSKIEQQSQTLQMVHQMAAQVEDNSLVHKHAREGQLNQHILLPQSSLICEG